MNRPILVEIAAGELIDKITILQIKSERIRDAAKLQNVRQELEVLTRVLDELLPQSIAFQAATANLKRINEALWSVEDQIRDCERCQDFGTRFVDLARLVYKTNDHRAELKRLINEMTGSRLIEEKSYSNY